MTPLISLKEMVFLAATLLITVLLVDIFRIYDSSHKFRKDKFVPVEVINYYWS